MKKILVLATCLAVCLVSLFVLQPVSAHETVHVGDYAVEIGWLDEPPVVGQRNAIVVNVSTGEENATPTAESSADAAPAEIDISELKVSVVYGGESKDLTLQPLSEDSQGQYVAPILPTRAGQYTVHLGGKLAGVDANVDVQPEEVAAADTLQFPKAADPQGQAGSGLGLSGGLAIGGLVFGLAGLVVGLIAISRKH